MNLLEEFLKETKRNKSRGKCLHFGRGVRCNEIINAHSIQISNQLKQIVEDDHVYCISSDLSIMLKSNGQPAPKKISLAKVSTFSGFCKHHDNELFKPIDDFLLAPNSEQVSLYAYRCICREFIVKENSVATIRSLTNHSKLSTKERELLESSLVGHSLGFHRLKHHKKHYDLALASKNHDEFEYITFVSKSPWNLQLSGVLYPDYDFQGKPLQNLDNLESPLDLISFFTAPMSQGWSFNMCWHKSSSRYCLLFVESLRFAISNGANLQDALFRFSLSCCENHAFRISWWDELNHSSKTEILSRINLITALDKPVPSDYLISGMTGIADWEFDNVLTTLSAT